MNNELKTYEVPLIGFVNHTARVEALSKKDAIDIAWKKVCNMNIGQDFFIEFNHDVLSSDVVKIDLEQDAKDEAIRMFVSAKHKQLGHDRYFDIQDKVKKVLNELWELRDEIK
jgi:hypothetical protein